MYTLLEDVERSVVNNIVFQCVCMSVNLHTHYSSNLIHLLLQDVERSVGTNIVFHGVHNEGGIASGRYVYT